MSKPTRLAALAVGYTSRAIAPLLAMDAKVDLMPIFKDVSTKSFDSKKLTTAVGAVLKGKTIAMDVNIDHVAKMLDHLGEAGKKEPQSADESVSEPQHKAMMAAAEGKSNIGIPQSVGEEFKEADKGKGFDAVAEFLKGKGLGEDDIEEVRGMFPQPAEDEEDDEAKKKAEEEERAKAAATKDKGAKDKAKDEDMVTKPAMDAAIQDAVTAATKTVRETERGIRAALAEVRPWVGELPASLAFDSAADVHRHTAVMLGIPNAKTMHADALMPVIQAQPKPGTRKERQHEPALGMDSASVSKAQKIAPGLAGITIGA